MILYSVNTNSAHHATEHVGAGESLSFVIQRRRAHMRKRREKKMKNNYSIRTQFWNINVGVPLPIRHLFPTSKKHEKKSVWYTRSVHVRHSVRIEKPLQVVHYFIVFFFYPSNPNTTHSLQFICWFSSEIFVFIRCRVAIEKNCKIKIEKQLNRHREVEEKPNFKQYLRFFFCFSFLFNVRMCLCVCDLSTFAQLSLSRWEVYLFIDKKTNFRSLQEWRSLRVDQAQWIRSQNINSILCSIEFYSIFLFCIFFSAAFRIIGVRCSVRHQILCELSIQIHQVPLRNHELSNKTNKKKEKKNNTN